MMMVVMMMLLMTSFDLSILLGYQCAGIQPVLRALCTLPSYLFSDCRSLDHIPKEDLSVSLNNVAFPPHRDGSEDIVAGGHDGTDVSLVKGLYHTHCYWLELILHNKKTQEGQVALNLISGDLL